MGNKGIIVKIDSFRKVIKHPVLFEEERFKKTLHTLNLSCLYEKCCICQWDKTLITLTLVNPKEYGGLYTFDNVLSLCPNHAAQFKINALNEKELYCIQEFLWTICFSIKPYP